MSSNLSYSVKIRCTVSCLCLCLLSVKNFRIDSSIVCKLFTNTIASYYYAGKLLCVCDTIIHFKNKFLLNNFDSLHFPVCVIKLYNMYMNSTVFAHRFLTVYISLILVHYMLRLHFNPSHHQVVTK